MLEHFSRDPVLVITRHLRGGDWEQGGRIVQSIWELLSESGVMVKKSGKGLIYTCLDRA